MNLLALVKYSLDIAEIRIDAASKELRLKGVPEHFGDIDKNVVEAAVRLKESSGGTVQVLSFGPPAARNALKQILAMGVDKGFFVPYPAIMGGNTTSATVHVLEAAIRKQGSFDVLLCGFASDDGYTSQVGPRLAERLGVPVVSYAQRISIHGAFLSAERNLKDHAQSVRVRLPAVVTIAEESFTPRSVTLLDAMKAQKKPLDVWEVESDLGLTDDWVELLPRCAELSRSGLVAQRRQEILRGEDSLDLADRFIDALLREGVVREGA
jgi:electron transfer flavoprotein alpha/beta subunit